MTEYGKGYILKESLLDVIEWDNDVEKWVLWDDDLQSLMKQKNDVVEVVRCAECKNCVAKRIMDGDKEGSIFKCEVTQRRVFHDMYCSYGARMDGGEHNG